MADNPGHTQKNKRPSAGEVAATPVFLQSQDIGEVFRGGRAIQGGGEVVGNKGAEPGARH